MIWTRIKRWLAEHPRWSLIVPNWISFAVLLVVFRIAAFTVVGGGGEGVVLIMVVVLTSLWLLACGTCATVFGLLTAKAGLPLQDVRRRWLWVWAALASLWLFPSSVAGGWFDAPWTVLAVAIGITLAISALGVGAVLAGLGLADRRARRHLAAGRWATIIPVAPEVYTPAAAERQRVNRRTIATLSSVTAVIAFGFPPLLMWIDRSNILPIKDEEMAYGSLAALALAYIILTATIAVRRRRAGLTNTDLVLVGAVRPWGGWPALTMGILFLCAVGKVSDGSDHSWRMLEIFVLFALGSPALLIGAWLSVLLTTGVIWLIHWHRDPRYNRSAMKEFDQ